VTPILEIHDLKKEYVMGEVTVHALRGVNLTLYEGEFVVILGPSGSGKSTILNIAGGIDTPTSGTILFHGEDVGQYSTKKLTNYRRRAVGFVFQFYNLMQNLTAEENIALAAQLSDSPISPRELLEQIGLADRGGHFPSQLSGGEQQRIAIARAIAKNPALLLCDEPTGALDGSTGIQVLRLLKNFNTTYQKTVVIITHNASIGKMADRVLMIRDGRVAKTIVNEHPIPPEEVSW
jgi:putative ABC transport system ATP-binding protein